MIAELTLPRLGETMETGRIVAWLKQPGERFRRGETLLEVESDKTVVEMPALADGVLLEILAQVGQDADVGEVLCRYEGGDAAPSPAAPTASPAAAEPPLATPPLHEAMAQASVRLRATPLARAIARKDGIRLDGIVGTGPRGRIEARDLRPNPPASAPVAAAGMASDDLRWMELAEGRIAYRVWGDAKPGETSTVMLHGFAAESRGWSGLAAALARTGGHVIAPDLPGHGATPIEAETIEDLAAAAAAFLRGLGLAPLHLVGHSMGGAIAVLAAHRVPDLVARITLFAPAGLDHAIDAGFVHDIARVRSAGALGHLLRRLSVRPAPMSAAQRAAMAAEFARGRLIGLGGALADASGQQIDITADLHALACPARIVWGLQDRIIPWTQAAQAGSRVAVHFVPDAGHVPHWDQPAEVAALFA